MIEYIPRWIVRSARVHFRNAAQAAGFPMFYEGMGRPANFGENYYEFRVDGPYLQKHTKNFSCHFFEVNILCTCFVKDDLDLIDKMAGDIFKKFSEPITIQRLGDTNETIYNDNSTVGCAVVFTPDGKLARISRFGALGPSQSMSQAAVHGWFKLELTNAN